MCMKMLLVNNIIGLRFLQLIITLGDLFLTTVQTMNKGVQCGYMVQACAHSGVSPESYALVKFEQAKSRVSTARCNIETTADSAIRQAIQ